MKEQASQISFYQRKKDIVNKNRNHVLIGKERHDVGRPDDAGYPDKRNNKEGFLYLKNFKPERWPAGNPETGYLNVDGSPTKTLDPEHEKNRNIR